MSDKEITPPPVTPSAAPAQASTPAPPPIVPAAPAKDEFEFPELDFNASLQREHDEANAEPVAATPVDTSEPTRAVATPDESPLDAQPEPETKPAAKVEPKPAAEPKPAVAEKPAPPQQRVIDPAERIPLADGLEYSREQIVAGLTNGVAAHQEATAFRQIFNMSAQDAATTWGPLLQEIAADDKMGDYLERAIDHYRAQKVQATGQPQQPPADPVARKEVADLRAKIEQRDAAERARTQQAEVQRHLSAIESEKQTLATTYPALSDPDVMTDLVNFALTRAVQDPTYTLTRAATDRATYLSRLAPGQALTPTAAAAAVPALTRGGGTSPTGTSAPAPSSDDDVLSSGYDPVADYMRERASAGYR